MSDIVTTDLNATVSFSLSLSFLCESEERLGILEVEEMRRALTPGLPERWEGRGHSQKMFTLRRLLEYSIQGQGVGDTKNPEFCERHL